MRYDELVVRVRGLLSRSIAARFEGEMHNKKVQAQAYADGYMRALADAELITEKDLREMVQQESQRYLSGAPEAETAIAS